MYHDLDVRVASESRTRVLHELVRLGYDVVAFTTTVDNVDQLSCEMRESQAFNAPKSNVAKTKKSGHHLTGNGGRGIRVLERVTIVIDDPSQLVLLTSPALSNFDIVAVRPGSEKLLHQCLQFDFDVLSLILDKKQAFHLKKAHVNVAVEKGIAFEICYADALRDAPARRFLISNACAMSRVTSGRNIILSSGARNIIELRGPHDVVNLGHVFDLTNVDAKNCVTSTPENSVNHGDVRVNTHKGTVRIIADDHLTDRMVE